MKTHVSSANPDFLVQWHSASARASADIYCASSQSNATTSPEDFRKTVAIFHTPTTHIEVTEVTWVESTELLFTPNRPGFCSVISTSAPIKYGYTDEQDNAANMGRVLFLLPGKEISSHHAPGTIRTVICSFDSSYAESIVGPLARLSQSQLLGSLDVRSSLISAMLLRLMHEALHPGPLSHTLVESFGHSLLLEYAHWLLADELKSKSEARLSAHHFALIEEYLAGLSGKLPCVAELAAACGFSERYFAKLFREQTSCSVTQYMKAVQISRAKVYLLETDLPLKEIAYQLGFSTPANFSFAFREATGSTPGKFRKAVND